MRSKHPALADAWVDIHGHNGLRRENLSTSSLLLPCLALRGAWFQGTAQDKPKEVGGGEPLITHIRRWGSTESRSGPLPADLHVGAVGEVAELLQFCRWGPSHGFECSSVSREEGNPLIVMQVENEATGASSELELSNIWKYFLLNHIIGPSGP